MKNFLSFLLLMLLVKSGLTAQQNHFIYIQSENRQTFTVNLNNKSYASSTTGYVIIPKLQSGDYNFTIKPTQQNSPESKFYVAIDKKDVGFTFKTANNSFALTNIQNYVTLSPGEKPVYASVNSKSDIAKNTAKTENKAPAIKLHKGVNKISEVQASQAVTLLYLDVQDKKIDTIDIIIPTSTTVSTKMPNRNNAANSKLSFLPLETKNLELGLQLVAVNQDGYNTRCVNLASGDDFFRIRKKMASESSDDKMINEAKKAAKNKCYTTVQIKNLSALFMTDEGKFKFFTAMYPLIYDIIQYPTLEKEFTTAAYAEKFRNILHK